VQQHREVPEEVRQRGGAGRLANSADLQDAEVADLPDGDDGAGALAVLYLI
jgi:hypothetical protein